MPQIPTRVFISYSQDSAEHMNAVLALANRLRKEGVDCWIDQHLRSPSEGWPRWCENQIETAKFVLVACTKTYLRRFRGKEEPGRGRGATFEGFVITQELYDNQGKNEKFIPIVFAVAAREHIPTLLQGASNYDVSTPEGYDDLYWGITDQFIAPPEIGKIRNRPRIAVPGVSLPRLESHRDFTARLSNVPLAPSPFFTGRENILEEVRKRLGSSKRVALSGMRGVGKTQAAAQYAHRRRSDYQAVLWARAETRETLVGDFASIARLLNLPQRDEKDQSVIVGAMKQWLETNVGWLLVLDNADDLTLVREFVPPTHSGHLLLTTTALALGGIAEKVPVEEMDTDEGALLLLRRATVIPKDAPLNAANEKDRASARDLARELGGLPLALDQAGAYIEETPSTLAEYRDLYEQEGKRLLSHRGELSPDHPSVTVTFSLAFSELARRDPVAADLVRLCAFLAPGAIPEELFTKGASALGEEFSSRAKNPLEFVGTVKQAAKFSLIRRDAPDRSLDIHRLVQGVLKDEMDSKQLREWAERAVRAVNLAFPHVDFRDWPDCERLLPHAKACAALIEDFSLEFNEAARLLNQTASYMDDRAQYGEAEPLYRRALAIREKALGPEHPDVANSLNNLAVLYRKQGRYAEAEPLYQCSLAIREKALGPEHPDVANSLNNLAVLYEEQGRHAEAGPLLQRSLAISGKALGPEHLHVAHSLNNLALLYVHQGRHAEAEPLYQRSLAIWEKALGPEHPHVATCLNNLALLYVHQGRHAEAEPLYQRALAIDEKTLGSDHPGLATDLNNLAGLYNNQGRYTEAEPLFQRSLAIYEKSLGPNHPSVATVLKNYADLLRKTGREAEARSLEARAKAIREKTKKIKQ